MGPEVASEKNRRETPGRHRGCRYGITGPAILIVLGVMFLAGQFFPSWGVSRTWPVLLIVIGIVKLLESIHSKRLAPPD